MRWAVLVLFGIGCTPDPPPGPDLHVGVPAIRLHRLVTAVEPGPASEVDPGRSGAEPLPGLAAIVELEPSSWRAADGPVAARFGLRLRAELPPEVETRDARFAPPGLTVLAEGEPLPWRVRPGDGETPGYRLSDGALLIGWPPQAPPPRVQLLDRRAAADRSDPLRAPLRVGDVTLAGLRLRPGQPIAVDVPAGGELRATLAARGAPAVLTGRSDGREVFQVALTPGRLTELRTPVSAGPLELSAEGEPGSVAFLGAPTVARPPPRAPRRVVWVGLDTLRPDHLGHRGYPRPTSPNLDAFASRATVFTDAVAPAPRTRPSFRSALTGRDPLTAVGAPGLLAVLGDAGFATAGIVANPHLDPMLGIGTGADRWELHLGAPASEQADRAIRWLHDHAHHDAALFVHFMDPHLPYAAPEPDFERFAVDPDPALPASLARGDIVRLMLDDALPPQHRAQLIARYDGEIASLDRALGRLFASIDALPGPTLVVVFSDHGEELWDRGGFEHNHSLAPEVVDAVLLIREPGQTAGRVVGGLVGLADLLPTTLDILGESQVAGAAGRSLVPALRGGPIAERALGVGHLMYGEERWAVRTDRWSYTLWTASGRETVHDRRADPQERSPVRVDADTLGALRRALADAHGAEVGPGWRVEIDLRAPITLHLPSPAEGAGVIDPEAARAPRANQVWGERPPLSPADVARVALSPDGRTVQVTPGAEGRGQLWIRTVAPSPAGQVEHPGGRASIASSGAVDLGATGRLQVRPGTVIVPPPSEIERLNARGDSAATATTHQVEALRALGYLGDDP